MLSVAAWFGASWDLSEALSTQIPHLENGDKHTDHRLLEDVKSVHKARALCKQ